MCAVARSSVTRGDCTVVWCAVWFEFCELSGELVDAVFDLGVSPLLRIDDCSGVDDCTVGVSLEVVEPVRDRTTRWLCRCGRDVGGEFVSDAGGGKIGAVGGEDVFEEVDGVAEVVGVGGDADEVLGLAAGDGDVEPSAGGGGCGEGDGGGGGV